MRRVGIRDFGKVPVTIDRELRSDADGRDDGGCHSVGISLDQGLIAEAIGDGYQPILIVLAEGLKGCAGIEVQGSQVAAGTGEDVEEPVSLGEGNLSTGCSRVERRGNAHLADAGIESIRDIHVSRCIRRNPEGCESVAWLADPPSPA